MPILDIQRRGREIGRIRIGQMVQSSGGRMRPAKLETFRLTTPARATAEVVARVLGGEVRPWSPPSGAQQWEILTEATELPVVVPPGDAVISQWYEMWSGGGCVRRCDGETVSVYGQDGEKRGPCLCPPAGPERAAAAAERTPAACKPTTRVNVMLPDLPDLGVWRIESHGYYAAVELGGAAEVLEKARDAGVMLPATLRLEQRETRRPGQQVRRYGVPVLSIDVTLRQMATVGGSAQVQRALPAAPTRALEASPVADLAAPAVEAGPVVPSAQHLATMAAGAATAEQVRAIGVRARALGLLSEHVEDADGVLEPLGDYLMGRLHTFEGPLGVDGDDPLHYSPEEIGEGAP